MAVHIVQCLCPLRHCIVAVAYDTEVGSFDVSPIEDLKDFLRMKIALGFLNPWCGICHSRVFAYEDSPTRFSSMKEAEPELRRLEAEQLRAGEALRNTSLN